MNVYAFVFARGGSKGVPHKNIRLLKGKPLLAYSIEIAKKIPEVSRIIVSTDNEDIASLAREWGAEVPFMRPAELATDSSPEWLAWQHALSSVGNTESGGPCDVFLSLPATAPLRAVEDVTRCLALFLTGEYDAVVTGSPSARHPMFNMVVRDESGKVSLAMQPDKTIRRRQDAPEMFDLTTVAYVSSPAFILTHSNLMEGRVGLVEIPRLRALDIDDEIDFTIAEALVNRL